MTNVYLKVHFLEKDEVKSLGAKWDPNLKKWYVPSGLDLTRFNKWLIDDPKELFDLANNEPLNINHSYNQPTNNIISILDNQPFSNSDKGISLSELLNKVKQVINGITPELEWIRAEVSEYSLHQSTGHCYLELVETNNGKLLSKVKAMILKHEYPILSEKFKQVTGDFLKPGMQILVLVKLNFSVQYGLSLYIKDLDPSYTIGDLAAKLAEIRKNLQQQGIYHKNKQLLVPYDFTKIAVLSPSGAAGLGDFKREAALLQKHNLCDFHYYTAQFQGKEASLEITTALNKIFTDHKLQNFELIVIIRGGGALIDLAWLNDYNIAQLICESPIPVFSGIGHERDHTIIDEIASCKFDTPSKVIAHILNSIIRNAQQAKIHAQEIKTIISNAYLYYKNQNLTRLNIIIKLFELKFLEMFEKTKQYYTKMQQYAHINLNHLENKTNEYYNNIKLISPKIYINTQQEISILLQNILNLLSDHYNFSYNLINNLTTDLYKQIFKIQQHKTTELKELFTNIISLGPRAILSRGYTIVRNNLGKIITSKQQAIHNEALNIEFHDGIIKSYTMENNHVSTIE